MTSFDSRTGPLHPASAPAEDGLDPWGNAPSGASGSASAVEPDLLLPLAEALVTAVEYPDPHYRGGSTLARRIAEALCDDAGIEGEERRDVLLATLLRDVGRLMAETEGPARPTTTPTRDEWEGIRRHVPLGLFMLGDVPLPERVLRFVRHHHERWDGQGYPAGLREGEIPMGARIVGIADAVAAMLRPRPYRIPRRVSQVASELRKEAGTQFDPDLADTLAGLMEGSGLGVLGLGAGQHVIVSPASRGMGDAFAFRLSRFGYFAEVQPLEGVLERSRRVPVEAFVLSFTPDPEGCRRVVEEIRGTDSLRGVPVVVMNVKGSGERSKLMASGADLCLENADVDIVRQVLAPLTGQAYRLRHAATPEREAASGAPALKGSLEDFDVEWLLQWMSYNDMSAAVDVRRHAAQGTIWVVQGEVHHAELGDLEGKDALRHILSWESGSFACDQTARPPRRTIQGTLMQTLLDLAGERDQNAGVFGAAVTAAAS